MLNKSNDKKIFHNIKNNLKLICMDIDGVLTDGAIYLDASGNEQKRFNVKDGMGIRLLQKYNFEIAWISGGSNKASYLRAQSLNIKYVLTNVKDKYKSLSELQKALNIKKDETVFLGDDINDLVVIPLIMALFVPSDAHESTKEKASWIGIKSGGNGFVREFVDNLLLAKGINPFLSLKTFN